MSDPLVAAIDRLARAIEAHTRALTGPPSPALVDCPRCGGRGRWAPTVLCDTCGGTGTVPA